MGDCFVLTIAGVGDRYGAIAFVSPPEDPERDIQQIREGSSMGAWMAIFKQDLSE